MAIPAIPATHVAATTWGTRPDGTEYWSAREYMRSLSYDRWENFAAVIEKAMIAAGNQGYDVTSLFTGVSKKGTGRPQQDFELSRFACYLVAMNGDPRKPEVAAAQAYFAIRTREAEMRAVEQFAIPQTYAEALKAAAEHAERAELEANRARELEVARAIDAPKVQYHDRFVAEDDDALTITDWGALPRPQIRILAAP